MVAALYIDAKRGPYRAMPDVDAWGVERDATQYAGPSPVVAHPPCAAWGRYAHLHHCGEHCDPECRRLGPIAVEQVRRYGGVLEHPRDSRLWRVCGLPLPGGLPDAHGGWSIEVFQRDWGHRADKPTWLYVVGCALGDMPSMPPSTPSPSRWTPKLRTLRTLTDLHRHKSGTRGELERMSKTQRHLTPPAFAAWLVALASRCRTTPKEA
jgi:hypothetical protein